MEKLKILIIDDEADFCKLIKMNLEATSDFKVDCAINGKDGIKLAKKIKPSLILLDIKMPDIDGFEVLKVLREDLKTISLPVVMLSALGDDTSKIKASGLYDDEYITKPIETPVLINKIKEVLKRRQGQQ